MGMERLGEFAGMSFWLIEWLYRQCCVFKWWERWGVCEEGVGQVHRIHDLMDINMLRLAKEGVDGTYKTMVRSWATLATVVLLLSMETHN